MKSVFLMLYLWHSWGAHQGGPALVVIQMPNLAVCEAVGNVAKGFVDNQTRGNGWTTFNATPSDFRCIEVDDKPVTATPKCAP